MFGPIWYYSRAGGKKVARCRKREILETTTRRSYAVAVLGSQSSTAQARNTSTPRYSPSIREPPKMGSPLAGDCRSYCHAEESAVDSGADPLSRSGVRQFVVSTLVSLVSFAQARSRLRLTLHSTEPDLVYGIGASVANGAISLSSKLNTTGAGLDIAEDAAGLFKKSPSSKQEVGSQLDCTAAMAVQGVVAAVLARRREIYSGRILPLQVRGMCARDYVLRQRITCVVVCVTNW